MSLFPILLARLIPLYAIIGLGYFAGRRLGAQKETIATLLIYIVAPIVVFDGVLRTPLTLATLTLPVLFFCCCCLLCILFYALASLIWTDAHRNVLALAAGTGNTGYFGLPVALALFGESHLGYVVLATLGFILYENSLGFFIVARGKYSARESIGKLLKLPTLYAFFIAILVQQLVLPLGDIYLTAAANFRGAYSVLGMMMIGLGIASMRRFTFDWAFTAVAFVAKFVAWPLLVVLLILLDVRFFHLFNREIHQTMGLMSIVPMAANTISFATLLRAEPEKAALAVFLSTMLALVIIPIVAGVFLIK